MSETVSRRQVLRAAGASLALSAAPALAAAPRAKSCIFILCTGGPSQLDTWDPKPDAPAEIRGPYRAIGTNVSGIRISETLPRLARRADSFAIIRTLHSTGPAVHELACRVIQTGSDAEGYPQIGAVVSRFGLAASHAVLPRALGDLGLPIHSGHGAGLLGESHEPRVESVSEMAPERYGDTEFGRSCRRALELVEGGVGFVTVNQFHTLYHQPTWDCHGYPDLPTRVTDLKDQVALPFDMAVSALLDDLKDRGLYDETLVCCVGEFGRSPKITSTGGREHHTGCWSVMLGAGGIRGGQVVGRSDEHAWEPVERPVSPAELVATIYHLLGVPTAGRLRDAEGRAVPLLPPGTAPVSELL